MNRHFPDPDIQRAKSTKKKKKKKKNTPSVIRREMEIQTTLRDNITHVQIAIIFRATNNKA